MLQQIQALVKNGDVHEAWRRLQQIEQTEYGQLGFYLAAVCNRYLNQPSVALGFIDNLLKINPKHARGYQEQAYNYLLLNNSNKALAALLKATKYNPCLTSAWLKLADIYQLNQQLNLADNARANAEYYQSLPLPIRSGYSNLYEGNITQAQHMCQFYLQQQPDNVEAMRLLAQIASSNQHYDKAEFLLDSALLLAPEHVFCQYDLVLVLQNRQKFVRAYQLATKLVEKSPNNLSFVLCLANQAAAINQFEQAEVAYKQVLANLPDTSFERAQVYIALGHLYKTLGQTQQAQQAYQSAYQADVLCADAYWSLANLKRYQFSQAELQLMLDTLEQQILANNEQCLLSFALAKAFELRENFQRAACFYQSANHLRLTELKYNNQQHVQSINEQKVNFPAELLSQLVTRTDAKITPIFIVGLPRSGSTLLEQILASHSEIQGTMELPNIMQIAEQLAQQAVEKGLNLADFLQTFSQAELAEIGESYLQQTEVFHKNARYFIDKMPNNFKYVGLIKLILPQAKVIDIRRNINDACMANYKQYYAQGQAFSYNLRHCANFYHAYTDLMEYWSKQIPQDLMLIEYENLVTEPELHVKNICQMLGCDFQPSMLQFHQNTRAVKTPSAEQVRQPIYTSSIGSWQAYAQYLPELQNII